MSLKVYFAGEKAMAANLKQLTSDDLQEKTSILKELKALNMDSKDLKQSIQRQIALLKRQSSDNDKQIKHLQLKLNLVDTIPWLAHYEAIEIVDTPEQADFCFLCTDLRAYINPENDSVNEESLNSRLAELETDIKGIRASQSDAKKPMAIRLIAAIEPEESEEKEVRPLSAEERASMLACLLAEEELSADEIVTNKLTEFAKNQNIDFHYQEIHTIVRVDNLVHFFVQNMKSDALGKIEHIAQTISPESSTSGSFFTASLAAPVMKIKKLLHKAKEAIINCEAVETPTVVTEQLGQVQNQINEEMQNHPKQQNFFHKLLSLLGNWLTGKTPTSEESKDPSVSSVPPSQTQV